MPVTVCWAQPVAWPPAVTDTYPLRGSFATVRRTSAAKRCTIAGFSIPVSKATSWLGQAARPFRVSRRSVAELFCHGLMCPASSIFLAPSGAGVQAAEDTSAAAVGQHVQRENVLAYTGRGQDDPFGILLWPVTRSGVTSNLVPQGAPGYRCAQLVLAEEGKLAAVLKVEEM